MEDDFTSGIAGKPAPPPGGASGSSAAPPGRSNPPMGTPPMVRPDPGRPTPPGTGGAVAPSFPLTFGVQVLAAGEVVLATRSARPLYMLTCSDQFVLEQFDGSAWTPLRDDRPPSSMNPGYYLDGTFVPPSFDEGCDVLSCVPLPPRESVGQALEYYRLGSMDAPAGSGLGYQVPVIESRGYRGDLRVRVTYSEDANCATFTERTVEFNVPQGVCCSIGAEGCANGGWRGGWAPTDSECRYTQLDLTYLRSRQDGWGCQTLVADPQICCGCDADAGVAP